MRTRNQRLGRNSTCTCGSGRKVKHCHPEYLTGDKLVMDDGSERQRHATSVLKVMAESRNTRRYVSGLLKMANGFRSQFFGGWEKSSDKHPMLPNQIVNLTNKTSKKRARK